MLLIFVCAFNSENSQKLKIIILNLTQNNVLHFSIQILKITNKICFQQEKLNFKAKEMQTYF